MTSPRVGVYPGTFDPVTNGHMDIILRASRLVDRLVVGVAVNAGKGPMFSIAERVEMLRDEVAALEDTNGTRIDQSASSNSWDDPFGSIWHHRCIFKWIIDEACIGQSEREACTSEACD